MDNQVLRQQVMINQFVLAAGCPRDQAAQVLAQTSWDFQAALSLHFQEVAAINPKGNFSMSPPTNTPATPPNFPEALAMFSKMSTSDGNASATRMMQWGGSPPAPTFSHQPEWPGFGSPPPMSTSSYSSGNGYGGNQFKGVPAGGRGGGRWPDGPARDFGNAIDTPTGDPGRGSEARRGGPSDWVVFKSPKQATASSTTSSQHPWGLLDPGDP